MKPNLELVQRIKNIEVEQQRQDKELNSFLRDLAEVLELEAKLAKIENYQVPFIYEKTEEERQAEKQPKPVVIRQGYVIRLTFSEDAQSEWSDDAGGGWRETGMGMCYMALEEAEQRLQKLQKMWPNYPMEIVIL